MEVRAGRIVVALWFRGPLEVEGSSYKLVKTQLIMGGAGRPGKGTWA